MTPIPDFRTIETSPSESLNCIALNKEGTLAAAGGADKKVRLWDITDRSNPRELSPIAGHSDAILNIKLDPTGRYLASSSLDKHVSLINLKDRSIQLYKAHSEKVHSVAFSPDGSLLASGSEDGLACITKIDSFYENANRFKHAHGICRQVLFSPSAKFVAVAGGLGYSLIDVTSQTHITDFSYPINNYTHSVAFQNDSVLYLANNHNISSYLGSFIKFPSFMAGAMFIAAVASLSSKPDAKATEKALYLINDACNILSDDLPPASSYSTYYQEGEFSIRDTRQNLLVGTFGKFCEAFRSQIIFNENLLIHSYLTPQPQVKGCNVHKIAFWDVRNQSLVKTLESTSHSSVSLPIALVNNSLACAGGNRITLWDLQGTTISETRHSAASAAAIGSDAPLPEIPLVELTIKKKIYAGVGIKVFQAQWKTEAVAVKRCNYKTAEDKNFLLNEARKLSQLHHERIVQFKAVLYYPNKSRVGIVMEFLPHSLYDINKETELAWYDRLQIAKDIVAAVEFLHKRSPPIVHRDIKSLNVMVSEDKRAKLTDFGLSRIVETMSDSLLTSRASTFNWSAPENLEGFYSPASDIWSTAMTLYELASREIPYHNIAMPFKIGIKITNGEVPSFPVNTPNAFVAAAMSCLVKQPDKRSNATQLLNLLDKVTITA